MLNTSLKWFGGPGKFVNMRLITGLIVLPDRKKRFHGFLGFLSVAILAQEYTSQEPQMAEKSVDRESKRRKVGKTDYRKGDSSNAEGGRSQSVTEPPLVRMSKPEKRKKRQMTFASTQSC